MSSPPLPTPSQKLTNSKQYINFLAVHKQIAKNSFLLTQQYYPTKKQWTTSENMLPLQLYIQHQQKQPQNWIQLKMEKLLMEIRKIVYEFVIRGIDVSDSIRIQNMGAKSQMIQRKGSMQTVPRYSMAPTYGNKNSKNDENSKKLIQIPLFRVYIDFDKCQLIKGEENIGRMMIETEKIVVAYFRQKVEELVNTINHEEQEQQQNSNYSTTILKKIIQKDDLQKYSIPQSHNSQQSSNELEFTGKNKKKKKVTKKNLLNQSNQGQQTSNIITSVITIQKQKERGGEEKKLLVFRNDRKMKNQGKAMTQNTTICTKIPDKKIEESDLIELNERVKNLIQKSRQELNIFKNKVKNTSVPNPVT